MGILSALRAVSLLARALQVTPAVTREEPEVNYNLLCTPHVPLYLHPNDNWRGQGKRKKRFK